MIQSVVFDFDGTLVLSNQLKHDGFFAIAEEFVNGPASMQAILQDSPGDRSAILTRFAAVVDGGVNDFVVQIAQLGAPMLIDFFGALLDGEFVLAPDQHDRR